MTVILPSLPSSGDVIATSLLIMNFKNSAALLNTATRARDLAKTNLWDVWDRIKKRTAAGRDPSVSVLARETACETALTVSKTAVSNAKNDLTLKTTALKNRIDANIVLLDTADDLLQDLNSDINDMLSDIRDKNSEKESKLEQIQTETDCGDSAAVSVLQDSLNTIDASLNVLNTNKILKQGDIQIVKIFISKIHLEQSRLKDVLHPENDHEKNNCKRDDVKCKTNVVDSESQSDSDSDSDSDEDVKCKRKCKVNSDDDVKCKRKSKVDSDDDDVKRKRKCKVDSDDDDVKCKRKCKVDLDVKCKRKSKVDSDSDESDDDSDDDSDSDSDDDSDSDSEDECCVKPSDSNILDKVLSMMNVSNLATKLSSSSSQKEMVSMLILCMNGVYKNTSHIINSMPAGRHKDEFKKFQKHLKVAMRLLSAQA
jgi:hypothetical protein